MVIQHLRANVVGYLALTVALSGTSYAALRLEAGSVDTRHLRNGAVTSKKVDDGAVRRRDLARDARAPQLLLSEPDSARVPIDQPQRTGPQRLVTVPRAGTLFVRYSNLDSYDTCTGGFAWGGLYVDNVPVAGSRSPWPEDDEPHNRSVEVSGVVPVAAGQHLLSIGRECASGTFGPGASSAGSANWTIWLLPG